MNQRVREAVDALRVLDEHERLTALQMVTPDVRTRPQKRGLRAMWLVREKGNGTKEKREARSVKRKSGAGSGAKNPARAEQNSDFGLPGGDESRGGG
jgi:hypothetical protein